MTKPNPRNIALKIYLNADEFVPFRDKCVAEGVDVSVAGRMLIKAELERSAVPIGGRTDLLTENNLTSEIRIKRGPSVGLPRVVIFPSKPMRAGGKPGPRLRL